MRPIATILILTLASIAMTPSSTTTAQASYAPVIVTVELSCFDFSSAVIDVHNGDTVRFVYNDTCGDFPHTVTSTGTSGVLDQDRPQPTSPLVGDCFDSPVDMQAFITEENPVYELDLDIVNGIAVRNWQQPGEKKCVGSNGLTVDGSNDIVGTIPFHCRIHGGDQGLGAGMRAVLIIREVAQ